MIEKVLKLPEYGYTPNNYKALVKSTNLTNAEFYRKFGIPEQTFYNHYSGKRTMNWKKWQDLCDAVIAFKQS